MATKVIEPLKIPAARINVKKKLSRSSQSAAVESGKAPRGERGRFLPIKPQADFKGSYTFGFIPTDILFVDPTYQRKLNKTKVSKIAHNWNQNLLGVFVVSKRENGKYYVIDGQHRHCSMQQIENYPDQVFAQIFTGLTPEQEADMFYELDSKRDNLTPADSFHARLGAKHPDALAIEAVANSVGFDISYEHTGPAINRLRAYKTLQDIYRRHGSNGLLMVLKTSREAWPDKREAVAEPILRGLELFFEHYPQVDQKRLVKMLSTTTPLYVVSAARRLQESLSSVIYSAVGQTIRGIYNKKLQAQNRLPSWNED